MREIIFAGFGGQGVLTGGLVMAEMASAQGLGTVWMPAYGPTMRGGKANCVVKYVENPGGRVGSPIMESADVLVAMNVPALDYLSFCKEDALVFVNTHTVPADQSYPDGMTVVGLDCAALANGVNNPKGQSLVMVGAVVRRTGWFDRDTAKTCLLRFFEQKGKGRFAKVNGDAFDAGYEVIQ